MKNVDEKIFFEAKVRQKADEFNNHPTKKPVKLMEHLVKLLSWEKQTILDPFMRSGSTGVACVLQDRNFIGYELEKDFYKIAERRLTEIEKQTKN